MIKVIKVGVLYVVDNYCGVKYVSLGVEIVKILLIIK